ncbi:CRISPR-associated ring nuclease Csm6 [Vibrio sp.]|nr:CRISPR-associated ring nuclease Csm6 [Vibrio sp.]
MTQKHVLLAVTGLSPAVVTETLYGIYQKDKRQWPSEIHIITTKEGKKRISGALIHPHEKLGQSVLEQMSQDLDMPMPLLCSEHIVVMNDAQGEEIDDGRTREEQEAMGDQIVEVVRQFCLDDDLALHASIAGGRKTMTFFLGYALSMFGREQDQLSHVLVSEPFEFCRDFFYPTAYDQTVLDRDGKAANTAEAIVELIDIPFIRQRPLMDKKFLDRMANTTYKDVVHMQNMANSIEDVKLEFKPMEGKKGPFLVVAYEDRQTTIDFNTKMLDFAFFAMVCRHVKNNLPYKRDSKILLKELTSTSSVVPEKYQRIIPSDSDHTNRLPILFSYLLIQELEMMQGCYDHFIEESSFSVEEYFSDFIERTRFLSEASTNKYKSRATNINLDEVSSIRETFVTMYEGIPKHFLHDRVDKLKKALSKHYTEDIARLLAPAPFSVFDKQQETTNAGASYKVRVKPENITLY